MNIKHMPLLMMALGGLIVISSPSQAHPSKSLINVNHSHTMTEKAREKQKCLHIKKQKRAQGKARVSKCVQSTKPSAAKLPKKK